MKLKIVNGSVTLAGNTILENVNFEINSKEHIAIVGRNGAGKSTLLKAIINNDLFDAGTGEEKFQITKIGEFKIGYMQQIEFEDENNTLLDEVKSFANHLIEMEKKMQEYEVELNKNNSIDLIKKYTELQEKYKILGGYTYKKEYEVMLQKFGFTESDKEKKISSFSGGERTKIAFIKLLLSKPDLLILDEPTNHLDIETIEWLEEYLKNYKGAIILVSHDRMFINNIANIIYDIEYGETVRYVGNYEYYELEHQRRYEKMQKDYDLQQKEIKRLMSIYERFRNKPSKASMALSKLHQVERMNIIEEPNKIDVSTFKINVNKSELSVKNVLSAKDLVIGYNDPLATVNLEITRGHKIGVIGKNGIGKSTLLKTLNGDLEPISGVVSYGLHVNPGYFDQSSYFEDENATILEDFLRSIKESNEFTARSILGAFLFKGDDIFKKINVLSGGEKVRLKLCKVFYNKPNFLLLDEPTNHMDIVGKIYLEEIFSTYNGTMIFVSHDRYFVKKIADQLLVFDDNGATFYPYGYDEYVKNIKEKPNKEEKVIQKKKEEPKEKEEKINIYELRKDLNRVENSIIKLETRISNLESELFKEDVYSDVDSSRGITKNIEEAKKELENLNIEWEKITDLIMANK